MNLSYDDLLAIILGVPVADVHDVGTVPRGPYMRGCALATKIEAALAQQPSHLLNVIAEFRDAAKHTPNEEARGTFNHCADRLFTIKMAALAEQSQPTCGHGFTKKHSRRSGSQNWDCSGPQQAQPHGGLGYLKTGQCTECYRAGKECPGPQQAQPCEMCGHVAGHTCRDCASQAQSEESCLDHSLRIQRLVEANTLLKQAQPEMPTREVIAGAIADVGWYTFNGGTDPTHRVHPLEAADAVLALFAPKSKHDEMCERGFPEARAHCPACKLA